MAATATRYVAPVQGKSTDVLTTRTCIRPEAMKGMTEAAMEYVDIHSREEWIDAFYMTINGYALTSCRCMLPMITCRAEETRNHTTVPSMQTMDMMTEFMDMMGAQNFHILNVLRRQVQQRPIQGRGRRGGQPLQSRKSRTGKDDQATSYEHETTGQGR